MSQKLIEIWIRIGKRNPWVCQVGSKDPRDQCAFEKPFGEKYFCECRTIDELIETFKQGNWCLGAAFYYKNICFINQIHTGDEWLVIRDKIAFESLSALAVLKQEGEQGIRNFIEDVLVATRDQLKTLDYRRRRCFQCNKVVGESGIKLEYPHYNIEQYRTAPRTPLIKEQLWICEECCSTIDLENINRRDARKKDAFIEILNDASLYYESRPLDQKICENVKDPCFILKETYLTLQEN